jgi:hypothetical protein
MYANWEVVYAGEAFDYDSARTVCALLGLQPGKYGFTYNGKPAVIRFPKENDTPSIMAHTL